MSNQYDSAAYRLGYSACEQGEDYQNPFPVITEEQEHLDYYEGWTDAELDLNDA